jgi:predicted kinase
MRKWMRERLQRRKKKPAEKSTEPAPPPLQPAYFEEGQEAAVQSDTADHEPEAVAASDSKARDSVPEAELEEQPENVESSAETAEQADVQPSAKEGARGKSRRRRGGRGRGGRVREKAVAQAFAPAVAKGAASDLETPDASEAITPEAEPEGPIPVAAAPKAPASVPAAGARPPKGIVVLAIGLPGSGKSSWFKRHDVVPLSSDMLRSVLFDDVREQRFQDLVFSNLRSMLKARLIAKRPMNYVDATNLTPQERQHWIKLAKDYNYEVHAVYFDVPLEVCIERHNRRDRVVPEDVMRRMAAKFKAPSFDEGFAKITVVRVKKKD